MKKLIFALFALCLSTSAWAKTPVTGTGWETVCKQKGTTVKCKKEPKFNFIGLRLLAGAPDLVGGAIIGRPLRFAQVELGGTTSLVGGGIHTGLSVFLPYYVSPGAHFEYGHQWFGNANKLVTMFGGSDPKISLLNNIEYDYINLQGSLGFGHPNWFMFRIFAGYSYIWGQTNGLQAYLVSKTNQPNLTLSEAQAKVWTPSAKIAFDIYF